MKHLWLFLFILLLGCSSTHLIKDWKNPDIDSYQPTKVLIVGMTPNIEARKDFEQKLKNEYALRGIESVMSLELFDSSLTTDRMTEQELKELETSLINDGFDTVLFTKVIGTKDKIVYRKNYDDFDETYKRFKEDFLRYQDVFYNPDYYDEYTIYHAETSLYCICPTKDRELIWKGEIDIVDPLSIDTTVKDYINLLMAVLEERQLINLIVEEKHNDVELIN